MPRKKHKNNIIFINQAERSSRFVVDLKQRAAVEEQAAAAVKKATALDLLNKIRAKARAVWPGAKRPSWTAADQDSPALARSGDSPASGASLVKKLSESESARLAGERIRQLAFYPLIKLALALAKRIFFYSFKLCYAIGWLTVFIPRFACLLVYRLASQILPPLLFRFIKGAVSGYRLIIRRARGLARAIGHKTEAAVRLAENNFSQTKEFIKNKKETIDFEPERLKPRPRLALIKPLASFTLVLIILVMPFKAYTYYKSLEQTGGKVLGASEQALDDLFSAGQSAKDFNFPQAQEDFTSASSNFLTAQSQLDEVNQLLLTAAGLIPNNQLRLAGASQHIVAAGQAGSELGASLSRMMNSLFSGQARQISDILNQLELYGSQAVSQADQLNYHLSQINIKAVPAGYQAQFTELKNKAVLVAGGLAGFVDLAVNLKILLGLEQNKRYLLIFQNNAELRASGGFIGSYALVDFKQGRLSRLEAPGGGSYDTEGGLKVLVAAPEPLWLVNPLWHFWDANWWPDWPKTARQLEWFYEKSDGPTVDGVISLTPPVVEQVLALIGPIELQEKYGLTVTADNFWQTVQELSERQPEETGQPKEIIGDLMDAMLEQLPQRLNKDNLVGLFGLLETGLKEKNILFYFNDQRIQEKLVNQGWDGGIKQTNWDYLAVINTNIAGGKSDRKIKETINHAVEVSADGTIIDTLEISRSHGGEKGERFVGVRNVDWMRVYVPLGSRLISAEGFNRPNQIYFEQPQQGWLNDPEVEQSEGQAEIFEPGGTKIYIESGKTVFANWSMVDPGQTITVKLKYQLPFKLQPPVSQDGLADKLARLLNPEQKNLTAYALLLQKQPGAAASRFSSRLDLPARFSIIWQYGNNFTAAGSSWQISDSINSDKYWAVLLEKNE